MSCLRVTTLTVVCNGCQAQFASDEPSAYAARIAAGIQGWHYAVSRKRPDGKKGQREFDYCPACWPTSPHARGEA